jgi:hypothetical protein
MGEGRKEKGEGRTENGRREKGARRREKGERRSEASLAPLLPSSFSFLRFPKTSGKP